MKHKYEKKQTVDVIGKLDIVDGKKVLMVELKDESFELDVEEILDSMVGMNVQFKSEDLLG